jgi:hypothetical protein
MSLAAEIGPQRCLLWVSSSRPKSSTRVAGIGGEAAARQSFFESRGSECPLSPIAAAQRGCSEGPLPANSGSCHRTRLVDSFEVHELECGRNRGRSWVAFIQ